MKITTWNVNGYRAAYEKGFSAWVQQHQADILGLQEIKVKPEQLTPEQKSHENYHITWHPAQQAGYSGVALFRKNPEWTVSTGLGEERFDMEGRVIRVQTPKFVLYNIYFPNGQRGQERVDYKLEFYAALLRQCDEIHAAGGQIIIMGDFNTAHNEIDLANPKENSKTSGFLPEERAWVDTYLQHQFVDAFRELYPTREKAYTWWTYRMRARERNVGWRLDYFLVSKSLMESVKDVEIHADVKGSDHCPVSLILED
ncbi:MAG TPA: exodeoxyribonuclease III [Anaerolineaceae bacterium]|nr:exodeoxyribonuclease III [Anaerolineaceae bacterium]HPN50822.1 exodeoxyribonuclease III [Anaerolineaceae bacterium]